MPRRAEEQTDVVNSDSFLDIVASVVSIMIIMVVMEGSRIKNAPPTAALNDKKLGAELEKTLREERNLRDDIYKTADEIEELQKETGARRLQRNILATAVSALEHKIESHRAQLDQEKRQSFDLAKNLSDARFQLDQLNRRLEQVEPSETAPVVVENYPTPISHLVDKDEAHFQLSRGAILHIPLKDLIKKFQHDARNKAYKLLHQPEITETIGPDGGFRLRYTLQRHDISPEEARITGRFGSMVELKRWALIPVDEGLGEPVETALAPGSDFHKALEKLRPGRDTVTLWIDEDSFAAFRSIRKELYRLGFGIAARPLPHGQLISGSPEGSKSAAQ
ncbi:MAG: hypothetical protein ACWGMZ_00405 [Thermoguttaceae bacterium]